MIKLFLNKFGPGLLDKWWSSLHHPSGFAIRYVAWNTLLIALLYCFFFVDVPWKEKTAPELYIGNEVEQYRLHGNTKKLFIADKEAERLDKECRKLKGDISDIQILIWNLKAIAKSNPAADMASELEEMDLMMLSKKKALVDATTALAKATHSFDLLVAQR
tara:strand:+ start:5410 stop:5892 length:483 start_codon:yes stop_codon:yes gene_type:complete